MCGDLEENDHFEGDLLQRFLVHGNSRLALAPSSGGSTDGLNAYLDKLFADTLGRCIADAKAAEVTKATMATDGYRVLAMQSLVMARVAGFLAGHVALREDPLRKLIEAAMLGYGEAETSPARHDHGHDHDHDHDHVHDHERAHEHGHMHGDDDGHPSAHGHHHHHGDETKAA